MEKVKPTLLSNKTAKKSSKTTAKKTLKSSPNLKVSKLAPNVYRIVVQRILDLGNEALGNLGVEERIEDVAVFFTDAFYI